MRSALICCLLLAGCSLLPDHAPEGELTQNTALVVGSWTWVRSTYYETLSGHPATVTPASAGYTRTLKFGPDGFIESYRNGHLEKRTVYRFDVQRYDNGTKSDTMLFVGDGAPADVYLNGEGAPAEFGVSAGRLRLSTAYVDGPEEWFRRQP